MRWDWRADLYNRMIGDCALQVQPSVSVDQILRLLAAGRSLNEIAEALGLRHKTIANT